MAPNPASSGAPSSPIAPGGAPAILLLLGLVLGLLQSLTAGAAGAQQGGDTKRPIVYVPANFTVPSQVGVRGAVVTYAAPTASDESGVGPVSCTWFSGSLFPIGTTLVSCQARDGAGNIGSNFFTVTVRDAQAPTFAAVANVVVSAAPGSTSAVVGYATPTVTDNGPAAVAVTCRPPSGSRFGAGVTKVTCSARDAAGNAASRSFTVTVRGASPAPPPTAPRPQPQPTNPPAIGGQQPSAPGTTLVPGPTTTSTSTTTTTSTTQPATTVPSSETTAVTVSPLLAGREVTTTTRAPRSGDPVEASSGINAKQAALGCAGVLLAGMVISLLARRSFDRE